MIRIWLFCAGVVVAVPLIALAVIVGLAMAKTRDMRRPPRQR